jgi:hypothetical protein
VYIPGVCDGCDLRRARQVATVSLFAQHVLTTIRIYPAPGEQLYSLILHNESCVLPHCFHTTCTGSTFTYTQR